MMDGSTLFPNTEAGVAAGSLLSLAASEADAAHRCLLAAFIHMDQAGVEPDTSMVSVMVGLSDVRGDLLELADHFGHEQVRRRAG